MLWQAWEGSSRSSEDLGWSRVRWTSWTLHLPPFGKEFIRRNSLLPFPVIPSLFAFNKDQVLQQPFPPGSWVIFSDGREPSQEIGVQRKHPPWFSVPGLRSVPLLTALASESPGGCKTAMLRQKPVHLPCLLPVSPRPLRLSVKMHLSVSPSLGLVTQSGTFNL